MKYIVFDSNYSFDGDVFDQEFESKEEAIKEAKRQIDHLTYREKKHRHVWVLESVNPDVEAENHFDGTPIWDSAVWYAVQQDRDDDWGNGSFDKDEALQMLKAQGCGLIAVIEREVCKEEILFEDIEK